MRTLFLLLALLQGAAQAASPAAADKVVYLDFWASWCTPCAQSFPWLNQMQARYGERLQIVGVNVDTERKLAERFLQRHPAQFELRYDPEGKLAAQYQLTGMPSSILLDAQGQVLHRHDGFRPADAAQYEAHIRQALGL